MTPFVVCFLNMKTAYQMKLLQKNLFYRTVLNCIFIVANEVYSIAVKDMLEITHILIILAFCLMFLIIFFLPHVQNLIT